MPVARLFVLRAHRGMEQDVEQTAQELHRVLSRQSGFIVGWDLRSVDRSGELVRLTVWESQADADRAAGQEMVMALRSKLLMHAEEAQTAGGTYEAEGMHPGPRLPRGGAGPAP